MEFDNNLAKESKKINRNNLENIEKFLQVYSQLLSENHVFILQLKMWLIEGLNRLPNGQSKEDILLKKLKLIKQVKNGLKNFESTYSYLNGVLNLEMAETILQKLYQIFGGAENFMNVDPYQLLEDAEKSVKIAEIVFKNEDAKSQDHCLKMKLAELKMSLSTFKT